MKALTILWVRVPLQKLSFVSLHIIFLGGGFKTGNVYEIYGEAGTGKSQLSMQMSINVTLPQEIGGLAGKAVYLDCDGGFSFRRLREISQATKAMVLPVLHPNDQQRFHQTDLMDGVLYKRIESLPKLVDSIDQLANQVLPSTQNVRLLIIDSFAFYFRYHTICDATLPINGNPHSILYSLIQRLNMLAHQWGLAVLLTNQMTTKFNEAEDILVPALGESWSHCCTTRIYLQHCSLTKMIPDDCKTTANSLVRKFTVTKSSFLPSSKNSEAYFVVTKEGIRGSTKPLP